MRRMFLLLLLAAASLPLSASAKPRVSRVSLAAMERSFDQRVIKLWSDDNTFVLMGNTRGIYLEGYGAVFTAEINLVTGPTMLGRVELSKEEIARFRQKKLQRLPQLKEALRQMMVDAAASLDGVPPDEQIVISVFLSSYPWEDKTGLPSQVMMQAEKGKLLAAQRAKGAGLEAAIHVQEY